MTPFWASFTVKFVETLADKKTTYICSYCRSKVKLLDKCVNCAAPRKEDK